MAVVVVVVVDCLVISAVVVGMNVVGSTRESKLVGRDSLVLKIMCQ